MIIECPLNGQYHDRRDVILTARMAVSNNFITVTVIKILKICHFNLVNPGNIVSFKKFHYFLGNICYNNEEWRFGKDDVGKMTIRSR